MKSLKLDLTDDEHGPRVLSLDDSDDDDDDDFSDSNQEPWDGTTSDLSSFNNRVTIFDQGWCSPASWRDRCSSPYKLRIFLVMCVVALLISIVVTAVSGNSIGDADKSIASVAGVVIGFIFIVVFGAGLVALIRQMHFANQVEEF